MIGQKFRWKAGDRGLKKLVKALVLGCLSLVSAVYLASHATPAGAEEQILSMDTTAYQNQNWQGGSFPVENFQAYTSPYGYRTSPSGARSKEFHRGLDMAAPLGSYVRNWWAGRVIEVSDDSACGTSVVIQSGEWQHIYCHMKGNVITDNGGRYMLDREGGIQIWEGQMVEAGARIGRVGMTGRTTGPHLHWGLKHNLEWVDPALVLQAMYTQQYNVSQPDGQQLTASQ